MSLARPRNYYDSYGNSKRFAFVPRAATLRTMGYSADRRRDRQRPRAGPYRALTQGANHQNPVYPRPEIRFIDTDQAGAPAVLTVPVATAATNTGVVSYLNKLTNSAAGLSGSFTGFEVATKSVAYRFEVDLGPTPVPTSGRVCLIWDKQPNNSGTPATWAQIFSGGYYLSFMNLQNTQRFTILRNEQFSLSPNGDQTLFFEGFAKINMQSLYPTANNNTPTVPVTGALLLAFISDQATGANQPLVTGIFRVRYIDN